MRSLSRHFFFDFDKAYEATDNIGQLFGEVEPRLARLLRYRLESLAFHPEEEIRVLAYRILLLKAPDPDEIQHFPTFIESGLPFLNEQSIREIAAGNFGKHRLDALKRRLYWYRNNMSWPAEKKNTAAIRNGFCGCFTILPFTTLNSTSL